MRASLMIYHARHYCTHIISLFVWFGSRHCNQCCNSRLPDSLQWQVHCIDGLLVAYGKSDCNLLFNKTDSVKVNMFRVFQVNENISVYCDWWCCASDMGQLHFDQLQLNNILAVTITIPTNYCKANYNYNLIDFNYNYNSVYFICI